MQSYIHNILSKIFDGSFIKFQNRQSASELLFSIIKSKVNEFRFEDVLILGIPRGGVIIGDILASKFGYQFDILIPRRILSPFDRELSLGAIMKDNTIYLNTPLMKTLGITQSYLNLEKEKQLREIKKREILLGEQIESNKINRKDIILVDDGVATGSTLIVSSRWIRKFNPKSLIILVPVCPKSVFKLLMKEVDHIESIIIPSTKNFTTVEMFYQKFEQIEFDVLINILKKYRK
ncbi:MAG: hypothetical protein MRJ93_09535 [Nitrososphaeraceae archaeon]|nr:hypothetical protein [Nitrososphaeraceae archaeon]